jgi:hypothetical protein
MQWQNNSFPKYLSHVNLLDVLTKHLNHCTIIIYTVWLLWFKDYVNLFPTPLVVQIDKI